VYCYNSAVTELHDFEVIKLLLQRGANAIQESEINFPECRHEESKALLRKWRALTPARRNAVFRIGWDYNDAPTRSRWTRTPS